MEVMLYAKGISWIDDCRIPFTDGGWGFRNNKDKNIYETKSLNKNPNTEQNTQGRFPANILVSDDMLNDGIECSNMNKKNRYYPPQYKDTSDVYGKYTAMPVTQYADKGTNSRYYDIDKWFENLLEL